VSKVVRVACVWFVLGEETGQGGVR